MGYRVYLLGFRESDLSSDEQAKLDDHISKWSSGWSGDPYNPIDSRSSDFQNVEDTFADEGPRDDGKKIVVFQEMGIDENKDKPRFLEVFTELKSLFSDVLFEAHDDNGKIG